MLWVLIFVLLLCENICCGYRNLSYFFAKTYAMGTDICLISLGKHMLWVLIFVLFLCENICCGYRYLSYFFAKTYAMGTDICLIS